MNTTSPIPNVRALSTFDLDDRLEHTVRKYKESCELLTSLGSSGLIDVYHYYRGEIEGTNTMPPEDIEQAHRLYFNKNNPGFQKQLIDFFSSNKRFLVFPFFEPKNGGSSYVKSIFFLSEGSGVDIKLPPPKTSTYGHYGVMILDKFNKSAYFYDGYNDKNIGLVCCEIFLFALSAAGLDQKEHIETMSVLNLTMGETSTPLQIDGTTCGYWVVSFVESFLGLVSNKASYTDNFSRILTKNTSDKHRLMTQNMR